MGCDAAVSRPPGATRMRHVQKPFDLSAVDVKFIVSGDDLADVFYLTGLALPNTPKYRLAATVQVRGTKFRMQDLKGSLGSSDLEGQVEVQTAGARPKLTAKLSSATLNMADLAPTLGTPAPRTDSLSDTSETKTSEKSRKAPKPPAEATEAAPG